jgi:class 3 adenylate cyclase
MVRRRGDERGLVTLLFTDIVGSSEVATELGDQRWHRLQARHHAAVRKALKRYGGREVDTAGDGFFASFSSPARGVRCAFAVVREVRQLGLDVRAGLHIGEAQLAGEKVGGIAVTTAARVSAAAGPGQVLATDTIVHLVAGAGLEFSDIGARELKGVPGSWELFDLVAVDGQPMGSPLGAEDARQARDRSSPPEPAKQPPPRARTIGAASFLVVALAAAVVLFTRDRANPAATPTSGPSPEALVALKDGSGADAFAIDLPYDLVPGAAHFGPILLTGRPPTAFTWMPAGYLHSQLNVAQINRSSGAVVDPGDTYLFGMLDTTCVCVASAQDYIWTPISIAGFTPVGSAMRPGVSLRGIGLEGQRGRDIVVDRSLLPRSVSALVSGGGYLWTADTDLDRVYRIDPRNSKVTLFPLRQGADVMTFAEGSLFILDTNAGKLTRLDPSSGHALHSYLLSGDLRGLSVGGGSVWVIDASGNEIWQVPDDLGSPPTALHLGQTGGSPNAVAYDGGAIVVGFNDGTVMKINPDDPASPSLIWTYHGRNDASSIAVGDGIVWVAGHPTTG